MNRIGLIVVGLIGLISLPQSAPAQSGAPAECSQRTEILYLAEAIMNQRAQVKGFGSGNYGTEAAYLWLHYARPDVRAGIRMLNRIARQGRIAPRRIKDLTLAYAISSLGAAPGARAAKVNLNSGFAKGSPYVWRAIVLPDNGIRFFELLELVRADPELASEFNQRFVRGQGLAFALADLDDDAKLVIATRAEAAGEYMLAAYILASRGDMTLFQQLVARLSAKAELQRYSPDASLARMLRFKTPYQPVAPQTFRPLSRELYDIIRASAYAGEMDFLMILFNQTGWQAEIGAVAKAFLAQIDSGARAKSGNMEDNWLFLYDRIAARRSYDELKSKLTGFDMPRGIRHYAASAQTTLDWMRALKVIRPYLAGEAPAVPGRPRTLSESFDWSSWTRLATAIRQGTGPDAQTAEDFRMVVELYLAGGQVRDAIAYAQIAMQTGRRLAFYRDLIKRLDQRCGSYATRPGQWLTEGGMVAPRF